MLTNLLKLTDKKLKNIKAEHKWLVIILLTSFITRIIYVYFLTDYKNYLVSDMGGYWERALDRYNSNVFDMSQWTAWPPFYHFFLAEVFKLLYFFNLFHKKLEIVLFLNVISSIISVYFVYLISQEILKNRSQCLLVTFFYSFTYFLIYLNSMVMPDNLSITLIVVSFYLVISRTQNQNAVFLAGLLLGIAVALKPIHGLIGLPFFLYILLSKKFAKNSLLSAIAFMVGFLLVISFVLRENVRISKGELRGLAGYSGVVFFNNQCKVLHTRSFYGGHTLETIPPGFLAFPELAKMEFSTDRPLHDQKYFYKLGFQCIKKNSNILFDNLVSMKALFWGLFFPEFQSAKGFLFFSIFWSFIIIFMVSSLGFLYFLIRDKKVELKKVLLLISIPLCVVITSFFYGSEQRYLLPAYFAIYLLFFIVVSHIRNYVHEAAQYLVVLAVIFYFLVFR